MKQTKGYIFAILAALGFGIAPLLASNVFSSGISPLMLGFMRVLFMIPIFFIIVLFRRGDNFRIGKKQLAKTAFLALIGGVLTTALLFISYTYIDTGTATTLNFSYPIFVLVLGIVIYKEKLTKPIALSFILCVAGIILFCNPGGNFTWLGFFLALASGITYGIYVLYIDKSHILEEMNFYPFTFYFFLVAALIYTPIVLINGELSFQMDKTAWLFAILFALDGGILTTVFFQSAIRDIGSRKTSILAAMEPVSSIILGAVFLGERITPTNILGVALVLAATIVLVLFGTDSNDAEETGS